MDKTLGQIAPSGWLLTGSSIYEDVVVSTESGADMRIAQRGKNDRTQKVPLYTLAAVAAAVKEEDARLCDWLCGAIDHGGNKYRRPATAEHCAAAIRASIKEVK